MLAALSSAALVAQTNSARVEAAVQRITKNAILIDGHNDITSRTVGGLDIGKSSTDTNTDIPRLRQGGVGAVFFAIYVGASYTDGNHSANRALQMIDTVRHDIVARYPGDFALAFTAADIEAAHQQGKIAALMGIEGGHAIEDSPRLVRDFYLLGVRYMTLTHTNTNNWADSAGDVDKPDVIHHDGLTMLGKEVIAEMNRLGMIVDISHVSDKTFWDTLETSKAPIFASHSSCRALVNVPRNMTDEMIVALGKKDGVVQINFSCGFLSQKAANAQAAQGGRGGGRRGIGTPGLTSAGQPGMVRATLDDVVAHIDHVVKIAGIDHVGIGSDFDGVSCTPDGLDNVAKFPDLTRALLVKGYTERDIFKIYGENTLRLMRAVEQVAAKSH